MLQLLLLAGLCAQASSSRVAPGFGRALQSAPTFTCCTADKLGEPGCASVTVANDPVACAALGEVYSSTGGPSWTTCTSCPPGGGCNQAWTNAAAGVAADLCSFCALGCASGELASVRFDQLVNMSLVGSLSPALGTLTTLTKLVFKNSRLSGTIPSSLSSLTNLKHLDLSGNSLTGAVPSWLGGMSHLIYLSLGVNELTGTLPESLPESLVNVHFNDNRITGTIPASYGNLANNLTYSSAYSSDYYSLETTTTNGAPATALAYLSLQNNQLSGTLPDSFANLTGIISLNINSNQLTGTLPSFLGDLVFASPKNHIGIYDNLFTGVIPASLILLDSPHSITASSVTVCFPGSYRVGLTTKPPGSAKFPAPICDPCALGTVAPTPGSSCFACPTNTYAAGDGIACSTCPLLSTSVAGSTSASACACLPGYNASPNASSPAGFVCVPCAAGAFYNFSAGACVTCPVGSYASSAAATSCSYVPPGYIASSPPSSISPCPAGSVAAGGAAPCVLCPPGTFAPSPASTLCLAVPPGAVGAPPGGPFTSALPCPAGSAPAANSTACAACPPGTASAGGAVFCAPNPPGLASTLALSGTVRLEVTSGNLQWTAAQYAAFDAALAAALGLPVGAVAAANATAAGSARRALLQAVPPPAAPAASSVPFTVRNASLTAVSAALASPGFGAALVAALAASSPASAFPPVSAAALIALGAPAVSLSAACGAGQFQNTTTGACAACPSGAVAAPGSTACSVCPVGTYAATPASLSCSVCPVGSTSPPLSASVGACICSVGGKPPASATVNGTAALACPPAPSSSSSTGLSSQTVGGILGGVLGGFALCAAVAGFYLRRVMRRRAAQAANWKAFLSDASEVQLGRILGTGGFGTVFAATWRGTNVAVKVLTDDIVKRTATSGGSSGTPTWPELLRGSRSKSSKGSSGSSEDVSNAFVREVEFLGQLRHPNILAMYAVVLSPQTMLIMELGTAGSLIDVLRRSTLYTLPWLQRVTLGVGIAAGVDFLHSQTPRIYHLDLKSANVVVDSALVPKICDFGISAYATEGGDVTMGSPEFMAPEVAVKKRAVINKAAVDVYGLGCVLKDIAHINACGPKSKAGSLVDNAEAEGSPAGQFESLDMRLKPLWNTMKRAKVGYETTVADEVPAPLAAILVSCLAVEPSSRPTAKAVRVSLADLSAASMTWPIPQHHSLI